MVYNNKDPKKLSSMCSRYPCKSFMLCGFLVMFLCYFIPDSSMVAFETIRWWKMLGIDPSARIFYMDLFNLLNNFSVKCAFTLDRSFCCI